MSTLHRRIATAGVLMHLTVDLAVIVAMGAAAATAETFDKITHRLRG